MISVNHCIGKIETSIFYSMVNKWLYLMTMFTHKLSYINITLYLREQSSTKYLKGLK